VRAKPAAVSAEKAVELMKLTKKQIEVMMFISGDETLEGPMCGNLVDIYYAIRIP